MRKPQSKHPGGRPRGVTMPCGWGCGAHLTAREIRVHFTSCIKRPEIRANRRISSVVLHYSPLRRTML